MRDLADFLPHILPYVPNAAEPTVFKHLRDTCREVCQATKQWRENQSFTVKAPDFEALATVPDAAIVDIEQAQFDSCRPLKPKTVRDLDQLYPTWRTDTDCTASARYVTQLQPNSLTIYPRQTGLLNFGLVLQPSLDAELVPDWLYDQYGTEIGKGTAGKLLLLPKTEFANPQLGAAFTIEFDGFVGAKRADGAKGQQRARRSVAGSYF